MRLDNFSSVAVNARRARARPSWVALAIITGADAVISVTSAANAWARDIEGTLEPVIRVTARSTSAKAYQATTLATTVIAVMAAKASSSSALMPNRTRRGSWNGVGGEVSAVTMSPLPRFAGWRGHGSAAPSRPKRPSDPITVGNTRSMPWLSPGP